MTIRNLNKLDDHVGSLRNVRDKLRAINLGGTGYGAMRYASQNTKLSQSLIPKKDIPIVFNYLGTWRKQRQSDAVFSFAQPLGASLGVGNRKPYVWEINALFFDNTLQITWDYRPPVTSEATIAELASKFSVRLRQLIEYCAEHPDEQVSPQDFPNAGIDQSDLDDLLADYGEL